MATKKIYLCGWHYISIGQSYFQQHSQPGLSHNWFCMVTVEQSPLSVWDMFPDPQWMPETADSTKPYAYCVFSYTYIAMVKFNW